MPSGENQMDDGQHRIDPRGQLFRWRDSVGNAGGRDLVFGAGDPSRHRGLADQERARDLSRRQPAQQPQGQGNLACLRERWVATGEHQTEPIVRDVILARFGLGARLLVEQEHGKRTAQRRVASQHVNRPSAGHGREPGPGRRGDSALHPGP